MYVPILLQKERAHSHKRTYISNHTFIRKYSTQTHAHVCLRTHSHTHMHANIHIHKHTQAHKHIHLIMYQSVSYSHSDLTFFELYMRNWHFICCLDRRQMNLYLVCSLFCSPQLPGLITSSHTSSPICGA